MTKAILFDFWGTLMENGVLPSPIKEARHILWLGKMPFSDFVLRFEKVFMTKRYESLAEAFGEVCREFQLTPNNHHVDQLVGLWNKNRLLAKPFPETIEVLQQLKKKYKLVLISNTDCFGIEPVVEKYQLTQYFDGIVLSYKEGKLKTDKALFEKALQEAGVSPDEAVMVGDSLESDMKSAEQAGTEESIQTGSPTSMS